MYGGKYKIRKAIESKNREVYDMLNDSYDFTLDKFSIKRIYIDDVKRNVADFKDIKMFGTLLELCGYDLAVGNYEFINACAVEYHVEMFNKYRNHGWTHERFMREVGMASIDEGVSLNQLTPIYIKYRIGFHVVDFKYHMTASHDEHNYKPTQHYPHVFHMIQTGICTRSSTNSTNARLHKSNK